MWASVGVTISSLSGIKSYEFKTQNLKGNTKTHHISNTYKAFPFTFLSKIQYETTSFAFFSPRNYLLEIAGEGEVVCTPINFISAVLRRVIISEKAFLPEKILYVLLKKKMLHSLLTLHSKVLYFVSIFSLHQNLQNKFSMSGIIEKWARTSTALKDKSGDCG